MKRFLSTQQYLPPSCSAAMGILAALALERKKFPVECSFTEPSAITKTLCLDTLRFDLISVVSVCSSWDSAIRFFLAHRVEAVSAGRVARNTPSDRHFLDININHQQKAT